MYIILKIQLDVHMDMPIYNFMFSTQIHIKHLILNNELFSNNLLHLNLLFNI
jgi:hypothetical protein